MPKHRRTIRLAFGVIAGLLGFACFHAARAGDDWLPIPPADLVLKDNPASPGADAMILYRESAVDARESAVKEYIRIKVFTKQGTDEANVEIPFVKGVTDVRDIRARTIRPDGSIANFQAKAFEKVVVKNSGVRFLAKTFTLPDVQPGCIIEYKYRIQGDSNFYYNEEWTVSGPLFTRDARFSIVPFRGALALVYRQFGLPQGTIPQKQPNGSYMMDAHNIAAVRDEAFMPPERTLQARVEFFYRGPSEPQESTEQYWNRVGKKWNDEVELFVNKKGALEKEVTGITAAGDSPDAKLRKIFARVQQIRDLSYEEAKTEKERKQEQLKTNSNVEDVLKHGYGNGREINWLFIGLARAAGFEATEVYVVPRNVNFFYANLQDSRQLSADVVWVRAGGKEYWLDPAARFYPFGMLPWFETIAKGIRISKQGAEFVQTPEAASSDATVVRHAELDMNEDGAAVGKIEVAFTGQLGALKREDVRNNDETGRKKAFEDEIRAWLPVDSTFEVTKISNLDKMAEPLTVEGTVKIPSWATPTGRRMLVPVTLFRVMQAKSFEPTQRTYPIFFRFRYEETDDVQIHAPAGYKIETTPTPKKINNGAISFEIAATPASNAVQVKRHLIVDGTMFSRESYGTIRSFFNMVKSNDEAQVVLQNNESAKNN